MASVLMARLAYVSTEEFRFLGAFEMPPPPRQGDQSDATQLHEGAKTEQTQVSNRTPNTQCAVRPQRHRKVMAPF
jgi:hypothetical protein